MSLFQQSVLKKYLSQQDKDQVQKAYKKYSKYFHNPTIQDNIWSSKEEQFQEGFLRELFVDILGYTLNPTPKYNLTTELKNQKGAKKVDGAILKDNKALAVIELKGTNTKDLESIRQQAFDYKANQVGCIYVITSNFEKLRFYINNAVDYEEFNLFTLSSAEFEIFYLCLAKDNILTNKPLSIKEASIVEEETITKKFYGDYSLFKRELFRDLVKRNQNNELLREHTDKNFKLTLFKKSQKLIDRFLFVLFAEDRGLLAPNTIATILKEWKALEDLDIEMPLYDRYKQYFSFLDLGRRGTDKKDEIYAYNGGLFQPDAILDAIIIEDDLLFRHTKKLSTYDFQSQVDVNILGHIFEHSLNEIESINAEIEGTDFDKQKTKRKKDGVFYTPKYITKYIVDNTIGKLCTTKKQELGIIDEEYSKGRKNRHEATIKKLDQQLKDYRSWLLTLTICDPACGSGAFLNQALDFLIKEHSYLDELNRQLFGGFFVFPDIENQILEHNIYGVDLNDESIEIAKLSLWLRTAQPKRKLTSLNNNIKCGNSLIESKTIAGDKAFNWNEQFPEVFAKGGFDVIIGNPPYGASFNENEKNYIQNKYKSYQYKFESYLYFYEKGNSILNQNGTLSFITPELFLRLEKSENIRKYLLENSTLLELKFCGEKVFSDVKVNSVILTLSRKIIDNKCFNIVPENGLVWELKFADWKESENLKIDYEISANTSELITKIERNSIKLGMLGDAIQGLTAYDSYRGHSKELISSRGFHFKQKIDNTCGRWLDGKNLNRYSLSEGEEWLKYGDWLAAPREKKFFENPRILFREIPGQNKRIQATFTDKTYYHGHSITPFILNNAKENSELFQILGIVNSTLMSWYASQKSPNFSKKTFPKLNPKDIKGFPINKLFVKIDIHKKVQKIIDTNLVLDTSIVKFKSYFSGQYKLEKLTKKLENWYELNFTEFITELNKAIKATGKTPLTKKDEFDWIELFEENKAKAQALKSQIEITEDEIDKMVYELYGLSEEEITIIKK